VDYKYRHLGIGSKLVQKRLEWAKKEGYEYFVMRTASIGSNSFNLYKRMDVNEKLRKSKMSKIVLLR
jgi:GNAT superfamily N-acetyltransferase